MTVVDMPSPTFAPAEAEELLRRLYGIRASLEPLPSERDQNFRVEMETGERFILKLSNAQEDPSAIDFQTAIFRHLEATDPDLAVPRLVRTASGQDYGLAEGRAGERHAVRLVTYLPGLPLAQAERTPETLRSLGRFLGRLDRALVGFGHPGAHRDFDWEIRSTPLSRGRLAALSDPAHRRLVESILDTYDTRVGPALRWLRASVIHNDANDWNVLVSEGSGHEVCGLIDFGDAAHSPLVAELAVACAYAMLGMPNPLMAACEVVSGYHGEFPLQDGEFDVLLDLITARLAISVTIAAARRAGEAKDPYLYISEKPAWDLLQKLSRIDRRIATGILRRSCGLEATAGAARVRNWLAVNRRMLAPLMHPSPARQQKHVLDLGHADSAVATASARQDHDGAIDAYAALQREHGFSLGLGPWGEKRIVYTAPFFESVFLTDKRRNIHLGLDLFAPSGTELFTPLPARVVAATINPEPQDYGGLILLEHEPEPGLRFWTLWGHLDHASVRTHRVGDWLEAGARVAQLGDFAENGGWLPHLHLQLMTLPYDDASSVPGVGEEEFLDVWADLFPQAYDFAGIPLEAFDRTGRDKEVLLGKRRECLAPNLSISYREPLKMVRGEDVWLIDDLGRAYLDCYNNVAHVGHCHPRVVEAIARQAAILNTNTRYLHDNIVSYTERLHETLPPELNTFFVVCTGSEANDLALRMARRYTGRKDVFVLDWAYHGHTQSLIEISPYKYKRKGGAGRPDHTHEFPLPENYRAPPGASSEDVARDYTDKARAILAQVVSSGHAPAAFIAETIPSVAGQIFLPPGYLKEIHGMIRSAGGIVIADEVQVGFGRVGNAMWAFEEHGVVPDIVTMGKPIGNGHPLAVVAVRREIAQAFANGMEYFNTFGGNPVSCAAGLAVLDTLDKDGLLQNAVDRGSSLLTALRGLQEKYPAIGDVRGRGLFLGIEVVKDRMTKEHDGERAARIVNRMRELGVLAGTDGPYDNVIKLRPPMTFGPQHEEILIETLDRAIRDVLQ